MHDRLPSGDRRIDAAKAWAAPAFVPPGQILKPSDDVGFWTFGRKSRIQPLQDLARARREHLENIKDALAGLPEPEGGTPLYDTIVAGVVRLRQGWRKGAKNALVILTDGREKDSKRYRNASAVNDVLNEEQETKRVEVLMTAAFDSRFGRSCKNLFATKAFECFRADLQSDLPSAFVKILKRLGIVL
jgi:hypothetical protein